MRISRGSIAERKVLAAVADAKDSDLARGMQMSIKLKTVVVAVALFGSALSAFADDNFGNDQFGSTNPRRAVPVAKSNRAAMPADKAETWFVPAQPALLPAAPLCRLPLTDGTMVWVTLTTPGGGAIHINVEQVTSVRSDTQIPGAKAQLDLASGKLQGVVENAERVMQLIAVAAGAGANHQCS